MTPAELVKGRRYLLGFGPLDARNFSEIGTYVSAKVYSDSGTHLTLCYVFDGESSHFTYTTTNPERDVRALSEEA